LDFARRQEKLDTSENVPKKMKISSFLFAPPATKNPENK
jgi:hypothetical protein